MPSRCGLGRLPVKKRCVKSMLSIIMITAVGYGVVVASAYLLQRHLLYFPTRTTPTPDAWDAEDMQVVAFGTADGVRLSAWYRPPEQEHGAVVVYFHGNASHIGSQAFKARPLIAAGHGVLLVEYRGYAGNPGQPTEAGLYHDGRAALSYLREIGIRDKQMILYGESLGSGIAVQLASEFATLGGLILEAPFTSIPDAAARHYFWLPVYSLTQDRYESLKKIGAVRAPLLILHGERDGVVPLTHGRHLYQAAQEPKDLVVFPRGRHSDLHEHGSLDHILAFIRAQAGGRGQGATTLERETNLESRPLAVDD